MHTLYVHHWHWHHKKRFFKAAFFHHEKKLKIENLKKINIQGSFIET